MAFNEVNKLKICRILQITGLKFDQIIIRWGHLITAQIETDVVAEIARWEAGAGTDFTSVEPGVKNFGASIDPELERDDIRKNIATMLFVPELASAAGAASESFEIERG